MENYASILFIDEVRTLQELDGTAEKFDQFYPTRTKAAFDDNDRSFIASRESFYIASVSSTGWPYVQHRGGPKGFLKIIDDAQIGFIDYPGNRQFITMGHAAKTSKVALFLMDYERRARLKMLGHLTMQQASDADPTLVERLSTPGQARAERIATIDVIAMDWNCPKYIPHLIGKEKINSLIELELTRLVEENAALRNQLNDLNQNHGHSTTADG